MTNSLSQFDSTAEKALTEMARKLDLVAIGKKTGRNRTTKKKARLERIIPLQPCSSLRR